MHTNMTGNNLFKMDVVHDRTDMTVADVTVTSRLFASSPEQTALVLAYYISCRGKKENEMF